MKKMRIILFAMGLMAIFLMSVGCGEATQNPLATDPNQNELAKTDALVLSEATHLLTGTMAVLNEVDYKAIAPADFTGVRASVPQVQLSLKVNADGLIESAMITLFGSDELGEFKYFAESIAEQEFAGHLLSNGVFAVTLFDDFKDSLGRRGHIELRGTVQGEILTGLVILDGHEGSALGNMDLNVQKISAVEADSQ